MTADYDGSIPKRKREWAVASEKRGERVRTRLFLWANDNTYPRDEASENAKYRTVRLSTILPYWRLCVYDLTPSVSSVPVEGLLSVGDRDGAHSDRARYDACPQRQWSHDTARHRVVPHNRAECWHMRMRRAYASVRKCPESGLRTHVIYMRNIRVWRTDRRTDVFIVAIPRLHSCRAVKMNFWIFKIRYFNSVSH